MQVSAIDNSKHTKKIIKFKQLNERVVTWNFIKFYRVKWLVQQNLARKG